MPKSNRRVVLKYPLKFGKTNTVNLPVGVMIVHVGIDRNLNVCIWAEVDPEQHSTPHYFKIFGTGDEFKETDVDSHVATCIDHHHYVWHVYRMLRP